VKRSKVVLLAAIALASVAGAVVALNWPFGNGKSASTDQNQTSIVGQLPIPAPHSSVDTWPRLYVGPEAMVMGKPEGLGAPTYLNLAAAASKVRDQAHPIEVVHLSSGWASKGHCSVEPLIKKGQDRPAGWVEVYALWGGYSHGGNKCGANT
jgi:hypothetical protein